ncbi:MAG: 5-methyltetrahydropteroyltriglutamate--homocysteine S-methyltransferase [Elusimicrobiota bacterium]|jgi:5-methyltetrahydropteroyltriglutamate--homocysteine methyltransferase|nr:5-methyltetrahydropteroyltriglutamate--homocysteine S-methyltransferase [Elusimicrobiota bacterium]
MTTAVIGYPRIGAERQLKFATQRYWAGDIDQTKLEQIAKELRKENLETQKRAGIDFIPSNDFSFYDQVLDAAFLLNVIPKRYAQLDLSDLDKYFAAARGYQGKAGDVAALAMKKWFNTNYHYLVPQLEAETEFKLVGTKIFDEYLEAKQWGIETVPTLIGPYTFLTLANNKFYRPDTELAPAIANAYIEVLTKLNDLGVKWFSLQEPALVLDMSEAQIALFESIYKPLLEKKNKVKVLLQTYFGDIRDIYPKVLNQDFDGIGLDFVEGTKSLDMISLQGFDKKKTLFAGIVNGKNIWRNNYKASLEILKKIQEFSKDVENIVVSGSCSFLHVPYTIKNENKILPEFVKYFSFAQEKLTELVQLDKVFKGDQDLLAQNQKLFSAPRVVKDEQIKTKIDSLTPQDFIRVPTREERIKPQADVLNLPILPTTTIGSFPQTADVKENRTALKRGEINKQEYDAFNYKKIKECIQWQEKNGLDVLVHGEFERNDMVEYFGEKLAGFIFTKNAWVQSYGTRCVKPPIIWGDVKRTVPLTLDESKYAQSLTTKPVKGMLTGPVTILNWSFPREDISVKESTYQIALAIAEEVLALEAAGIKVIQIDEAALREKLPLRKSDWNSQYLDWAIPAFRLVHAKVKPETQIHTHMCYSEFNDIIAAIDDMDADVISFEASRSDLRILDYLKLHNFQTQVGPGVYDIHSPRVPSMEEMYRTIEAILKKIPAKKVWVNPDCGLKTRDTKEAEASLINMVAAAKKARESC